MRIAWKRTLAAMMVGVTGAGAGLAATGPTLRAEAEFEPHARQVSKVVCTPKGGIRAKEQADFVGTVARTPLPKGPPNPPIGQQTAKIFITADPLTAVKKALPRDWQVESDPWSDTGYTIVLQDKTRRGDRHAVLSILPPGAKERPSAAAVPGKTLTSILKATNGEVSLWSDAGNWTTIEQDLAKALAGEPMRVEEFVAEYRAPRDAYKDIVRDAGGAIMEARIRPNWLQLLRFHMTQEKFEQACRRALAERPVADIRKVSVNTGSHRDMGLVDMGEVWTRVGRQWPEAEVPLDQAMGRAASVLRATGGSRAEVYERAGMHMSTASRGPDGEVMRGGGPLTFVRCRQTFKVVEALRGQPVAGRQTVQYRFIEDSHCFPGPEAEQAIPPKTDIILLLDEKGGLLKVLPDTAEDHKAVKAAIEKVQRKPPQGEPFDGAAHPGRETQPGNTAAELPGKTLRLIPDNGVSYRVRESHVKTGGVLPGEYFFQLKLRLLMDGQEFKVHREKYEGTSILPLQACISDFRYKAVRADGQQHELTGREMTVPRWGRGESRQMTLQGRWDTRQGRFKFSESIGMEPDALAVHLAGVWAPALVVDFPERLKIEKGFSWGRQPQEVPRCLQQLSYLQQWTLTGSEESEAGGRLQLAAECGAGANERGQQVTLKRRVVYDTRVRLVTNAVVTFEARGVEESEKVELVMELEKER